MSEADLMRLALDTARKSVAENEKAHPLVGAVVTRDGQVLATACRGEDPGHPGAHAEYYALEHKLADVALAGATVYTTLEPCTSRNHPKLPCVERLIARKVSRVVIGMLDPNQSITGKGVTRLREAGIAVDLFAPGMMAEAEEMNRRFADDQRQRHAVAELIEGTPQISEAIRALCLRAQESIRYLVHALGSQFKMDDASAKELAERIRDRESSAPIRFRPMIVVDRTLDLQALAESLASRRAIYESFGVQNQTQPTFVRSDEPLAFDVLIADRIQVLIMLTTAQGSQLVQTALSISQHPRVVDRFANWFDEIARSRGLSLQEFQSTLS